MKNLKIITTLSALTVLCFASYAQGQCCDAAAKEPIYYATVEKADGYKDKANVNSCDLNFNLRIVSDVFQFKGENLNPFQERINRDLRDFRNREYRVYVERFMMFMDEICRDFDSWLGSGNLLAIGSEVYMNKPTIFSAILHARPTGGGGNGCRSTISNFNYITSSGYALKISFPDIIKDEACVAKLLELINTEFSKEKYPPDEVTERNLYESLHFAFSDKGLILSFYPYSISGGSSCVSSVVLSYDKCKALLSPRILKALAL